MHAHAPEQGELTVSIHRLNKKFCLMLEQLCGFITPPHLVFSDVPLPNGISGGLRDKTKPHLGYAHILLGASPLTDVALDRNKVRHIALVVCNGNNLCL